MRGRAGVVAGLGLMGRAALAATLLALAGPAAAQAPAAKPYALPKPVERQLPNQLKVYLIEDHRLPLVHYRFMLRAGSLHEPAEKAGLARFTAEVMPKGTATRDAKTLAEAIDGAGGTLESAAARDYSTVAAQVLAKDWRLGLELLADVVINPAFRDEEIERARGQLQAAQRASRDQNDLVADEHIHALVYGPHPYARPVTGDERSLAGIQRGDLVEFHKRYYRPNLVALVVVGDFDALQMMQEIEARFGAWPKAEVPAQAPVEVPGLTANRVRLLDKPGGTQTTIRLAHEGVPRSSPDYFPLVLMNYILGGGDFSSRLVADVRSRGGLTYDARTALDFGLERGAFVLSTFTRNEAVARTIESSLATVRRFREEGPTAKELEDAKTFYIGSLPLRAQTAAGLADQWLAVDRYSLGADYFARYAERIRAVTAADVKRVASQFLRTERLAIVAVGPRAEVEPLLAPYGQIEVLDYRSPTGSIPQSRVSDAVPEGLLAPESAARARKIIDRALKAHGGADRLRAVRNIVTRSSLAISAPDGQSLEGEMGMTIKLPDKSRIELSILGQRGVQVVDGAEGWSVSGDQVSSLSDEQALALRTGIHVQVLPLLLRLADPSARIGYVAADTLGGEAADVVQIVDEHAGARVAFAKKTGLLHGLEQEEPSPLTGGRTLIRRLYSDYREVEGLKVPFKIERYAAGRKLVEDTLTTYQINTNVLDTVFQRPAR